MAFYKSGRVSLLVLAIIYAVVGGLLIVRRDEVHRVKVYHGQAYIDCAVDNDDDPYTCVSDYTVIKLFSFNAAYVFGASLILSSIFAIIQMAVQVDHMYSTVYYVDTMFTNSLMTFAVAVVTGVQSTSTLVLMMLNTIMYETGMYIHDVGFWKSSSTVPYNRRGRLLIYITLNFITLAVNLAALIEYWHVSTIPLFIPLIMLMWFIHFIMLRYFTFRYFYGTSAGIMKRGLKSERISLFGEGEGTPAGEGKTRYEVVSREADFAIDWHDSWKNAINFFFKVSVGIIFYVGTNRVKIVYK